MGHRVRMVMKDEHRRTLIAARYADEVFDRSSRADRRTVRTLIQPHPVHSRLSLERDNDPFVFLVFE